MSMEEDIGYIKGKVESIELELANGKKVHTSFEKRIVALEKYTFLFIVIGPILLGAVAFLKDIKKLFGF